MKEYTHSKLNILLAEIGLNNAFFSASPNIYSFENIKAKHQKKLKKAAACILAVE